MSSDWTVRDETAHPSPHREKSQHSSTCVQTGSEAGTSNLVEAQSSTTPGDAMGDRRAEKSVESMTDIGFQFVEGTELGGETVLL